jgi:hypothetical protein
MHIPLYAATAFHLSSSRISCNAKRNVLPLGNANTLLQPHTPEILLCNTANSVNQLVLKQIPIVYLPLVNSLFDIWTDKDLVLV